MDIFNVDTSSLFIDTSAQSAQLESLSQAALSKGIDLYMREDYEGAVSQFKRAIGLGRSVQASNTVDAAHYMANAHKKLGQNEKAIAAYKTAIELDDTREDSYVYLGNLNFALERYGDAQEAYAGAVKVNPSANNRFSLGQAYIQNGLYRQAESQFQQVVRLESEAPNGYYGLGLLYAKEERYDEAVAQFDLAIDKQADFYDAYAEKGYALADAGRIEEADAVLQYLEKVDADRAETLDDYIYQVEPPRIEFAYANSSFLYTMPARSKVAALDDYLANASTSKRFYVEFQFSKKMDIDSVTNRYNWQISRSDATGPGEQYNFGQAVPDTEVSMPLYPENVTYNPTNYSARVYFTITQNATADGTIDPSHISFSFSGKDANGIRMDKESNQFSGFSGTY